MTNKTSAAGFSSRNPDIFIKPIPHIDGGFMFAVFHKNNPENNYVVNEIDSKIYGPNDSAFYEIHKGKGFPNMPRTKVFAKIKIRTFALCCPYCEQQIYQCDERNWPRADLIECEACNETVNVPLKNMENIYIAGEKIK